MPKALARSLPPVRRLLVLAFAAAVTACSSNDAIPSAVPSEPSTPTPSSSATGQPDPTPSPASTSAADAAATSLPESPTTPPPLPTYSHGTCPTLSFGPDATSSINQGFSTGSQKRDFHVLVPPSYDGTTAWPVMFAWHWLNAGPGSFINQGELVSAAEEKKFIVVIPDHLKKEDGKKVYQFDWPFVETWGAADELTFFDDMLACVGSQFKVDRDRVYGIGVSAGGLWLTYLSTTPQANHFAAIESVSGGLGAEPFGFWSMQYAPQPKKFPALVLWGGPSDNLGLDFEGASMRFRDALRNDHHFVMQCVHGSGHAMPPLPTPAGSTKFVVLWDFMLAHRYSLAADVSPYQKDGLPAHFPDWCSIVP